MNGTILGRPVALPVLRANIPVELKQDLRRWVVWTYALNKDGRWTKVPFKARLSSRTKASISDPGTWSEFGSAIAVYEFERDASGDCDGLAFALCTDDPFMGIDLDHVRDPDTGAVTDWAQAIVARMPGYWELSPSGTGLRHIRRGRLPEDGRRNGGRRKGDVEMYDCGRFLTLTGHILEGGKQP